VERGNAKHSPREDDALAAELSGMLGRGGSNREEWADPEGPADDDAPARSGPPIEALPYPSGDPDAADATPPGSDGGDARARHNLDVANDWHDS
jgi:hypothetical protein